MVVVRMNPDDVPASDWLLPAGSTDIELGGVAGGEDGVAGVGSSITFIGEPRDCGRWGGGVVMFMRSGEGC